MAPTIESDENDLILKVIIDAEQNLNCDFSLKTEQKSAIRAICEETDVFVVLPTELGKSIIYTFLPILFLNILTTQQTYLFSAQEIGK